MLKCRMSFSVCDNGQLKHHNQKKYHLDKIGTRLTQPFGLVCTTPRSSWLNISILAPVMQDPDTLCPKGRGVHVSHSLFSILPELRACAETQIRFKMWYSSVCSQLMSSQTKVNAGNSKIKFVQHYSQAKKHFLVLKEMLN